MRGAATATATATALCALLVAQSAIAQPPPPPTGDPPVNPPTSSDPPATTYPPASSGQSMQGSQMNFGSDGSDGATDGSSGSSWFPTPTVSTGDWGLNWTWKGASSDDGSSSSSSSSSASEAATGSGYYGDDDVIQVVLSGMEADLAAAKREKYFFDAKQGFAVNATVGGVKPGNCSFAYCMHFVFESDYGAMTPFDAFVLDRYESAGGPVGFSQGDWVGGPVPLVLGSMSNSTLPRLGSNWSSVLNWNETRRTTWTLHSNSHRADEIDLTLSLRQLYTFLPGYPGNNISSNGPFYSADLSDQAIIRVNAQGASAFAGASAIMPVVVSHTGSQLVDISLTSSLLYEGSGVSGGNEMQLTFKLSRRKYGGALPWFPAKTSAECNKCEQMGFNSKTFTSCIDQRAGSFNTIVDDLLSFQNDRTSFDIEPFAETCFAEMLKNSTNAPSMAASSPTSYYNGSDWVYYTAPIVDGWRELRDVDAMVRCWAESQCNLASGNLKADGQMVVLHHEPARTRMDFRDPQYSFYLQLGLEDAPASEAVTTQVLHSEMSPEDLEDAITSVFANSDKLLLNIEVLKYNNTEEIAEIESKNQWLMDEYNRALEWIGSAGSANSGGSNDGLDTGDASGASGSGDSSTGSGSMGSSAGSVRPRRPTLQPVPTRAFTIEIIAHNVTVVPHVTAVFSTNLLWPQNSTDNSLRLEVAPLNVSKFEYVPPGPFVNLEWREEPEWMTRLRQFLPNFQSNDSCSRCSGLLQAVLFDEDCAYGVNSYLSDALGWKRLYNKIKTTDFSKFGEEWTELSVDASDTLLQSRMFFPSRGFGKLEELLHCLSESQCNVDEHRYQQGSLATSAWEDAPPTVLTYEGAQTDMIVGYNETVYVSNGPTSYSYSIDGNATAFEEFLRNVVFRWEPDHVRNMNVEPRYDGKGGPATTLPPNSVRFSIAWGALSSPMRLDTTHSESFTTTTNGKVEISTSRTRAYASSHRMDIQWQRLESWLNLFHFVPFGLSTGSGNNSTGNWNNNGTDWSYPNSSTGGGFWNSTHTSSGMPTQPTVCASCSALLAGCMMDTGCGNAALAWLTTVLPTSSWAASLYTDGFYHAQWDTNALNGAATAASDSKSIYKNQFLQIMGCLDQYECAVGYSAASTSPSTYVPTTVALQATQDVYIPSGTGVTMYFKQLVWSDVNLMSSFTEMTSSINNVYQEKVNFWIHYSWNNSMDYITISGSHHALSELKIFDLATPGFLSPVSYSAAYLSQSPALPSWDGLRAWFDRPKPSPTTTTTNDALCSSCLPKVQACYGNQECWRSVQAVIVPLLHGTTTAASLPNSWRWDDVYKRSVYSVDVGTMLLQQVINPPMRTAFMTTESWDAFTDILQCFVVSNCDVETMESAALPPATAHVPSFLKFTPARAEFTLYMDSSVETSINGQTFTYTETGSGTVTGLNAFLSNAVGANFLALNTTVFPVAGQANTWSYIVSFADDYFGRLPQLYISNYGQVSSTRPPTAIVSPWRLAIEAYDQYPEWDKLLSLLSFTPPTVSSSTPTTMNPPPPPSYLENCMNVEAYKRSCYQTFTCRYLLNAYAIPALATALQTPPTSNYDSSLFEIDLTAALATQAMWKSFVDEASKTTLARMIYEATLCASGSTRPVFQNPRIQFSRPAHGALELTYQGATFSVHDETTTDGMTTFQNFIYSSVIAKTVGNPTSILKTWWSDGQEITYDIELIGVYTTPLPHLSWTDTATGERRDSTDSPWRLVFQSSVYNVYNDAQGWLAWLGTSPLS